MMCGERNTEVGDKEGTNAFSPPSRKKAIVLAWETRLSDGMGWNVMEWDGMMKSNVAPCSIGDS
eukprot:scaffold2041_cov174-Ochromonas_danica.AAC.8